MRVGGKGLSILPFESGLLVSLLLRITAVQTSLHGCSYSTGVCEFVYGRPARNARITCLRRCDERTCIITYVTKSLVHAFESCLLVGSPHAPAVLPTIVASLVKI